MPTRLTRAIKTAFAVAILATWGVLIPLAFFLELTK